MTRPNPETPATVPESIVDPESLRSSPDVSFHEETDEIDRAAIEALENFEDMAVVGVTNDDGEVLLLRVTEDCEVKLPTPEVDPEEDFLVAARDWVRSQAGLRVEIETVEGLWRFEARLADGDRTAERYFVVLGASPAHGGPDTDRSASERGESGEAAEVHWVTDLPDEAAEAPGTDLFFD